MRRVRLASVGGESGCKYRNTVFFFASVLLLAFVPDTGMAAKQAVRRRRRASPRLYRIYGLFGMAGQGGAALHSVRTWQLQHGAGAGTEAESAAVQFQLRAPGNLVEEYAFAAHRTSHAGVARS